ncbi:hypothetical protein [Chitinophaga sp. MM2321]|uniref:hypothetical protein n=1 Tax=Chitinophaga sp. MM2321 TaxID=3137178 RepID=UPI0032D58B05
MDYLIEETKYSLSYQQLKQQHEELCSIANGPFITRLPEALHLACIICYLKEYDHQVLSDHGIIHQLVHLLNHEENAIRDIKQIRKQFNEVLYLS